MSSSIVCETMTDTVGDGLTIEELREQEDDNDDEQQQQGICSCMKSIPYGVIVLIGSYALMVGLILGQLDPTEGLIYWAVDFFIFVLAGFLSLQMLVKESNQVGGLLFFFTGLGYLTKSFNTIFFGSNWSIQYDDDKTSLDSGVFILTLVSFFLWTSATVLLYIFVQAAWMMIEDVHGACGMMPAKFSLLAILSSVGVLFVGGIWSAVIGPSSSSGASLDDDPTSQYHFANILFWVAQLTWYLSFCSFSISVASVCGSVAKDLGAVRIWGLYTSWAAGGLVCGQVVVAVFLIFSVLNSIGGLPWTPAKTDGIDYPFIFFNFASMMSLFFIHNLVHMVFRNLPTDLDDDDKEEPDTEQETDNEDNIAKDVEDNASIVESSSDNAQNQSNWACVMPNMCVSPDNTCSAQDEQTGNGLGDATSVVESASDKKTITTEPTQTEMSKGADKSDTATEVDASQHKTTTKVLAVASMGMLNSKTTNAGVDALVRMASLQRPKPPRRHYDEEETLPGGPSGSKLVLHMVTTMDEDVVEV
jgi:hypothetical protein